jgi:hypothetical protein
LFIDSDTTLENSTKEDNSLTHFSSFAISAKDGSTRWHHLPGDFGEVDTSVKVTFYHLLKNYNNKIMLLIHEE